jgi:hypothetical protein
LHEKFIWIEVEDSIKNKRKVVFSKESIDKISEIINNEKIHKTVF